jgi:hypothetical protein
MSEAREIVSYVVAAVIVWLTLRYAWHRDRE